MGHWHHEVSETEHHLHPPGEGVKWFGGQGAGADQSPGVLNGSTPFILTAGVNTFGNLIKIFDGAETPADTLYPMTRFDLNDVQIVDADTSGDTYIIRFFADAGRAKLLTTFTYATSGPPIRPAEQHGVGMGRLATGSPLWADVKHTNNNGSIIDIMPGLHEYTQ